nr:hypothetical protein [Pirellulaceae bacterium]
MGVTRLKSPGLMLAMLAAWILAGAGARAAAPEKPNIVLILIDDMPWYGTDVRMDPDLPGSAMAFR